MVEKGQFVCLSTGFWNKFFTESGTFSTAMDKKHVQELCFLIVGINIMQFQENPMLLEPRQ